MSSVQDILSYIDKELVSEPGTELDGSSALFSSGLLSSLDLVNLIHFLEEAYGVSIDPMDVDMENFDTVDSIHRFLSEK